MMDLDDYLTSSGKYPERAKDPECTQELKDNALDLVTRINACLYELKVTDAEYSSGYRPSSVNKKVKNAAKKSNHMDGDAGDLGGQKIGRRLEEDYLKNKLLGTPEKSLLVKHDLYLEDPDYTPTWTHLQKEKTRSGKRIFIP